MGNFSFRIGVASASLAAFSALAALASFGPTAARAADEHVHGHGNHGSTAAASPAGQPGSAARVTRTVRVDMTDAMRFTPASLEVRQNEIVRFVVTNSGKLRHELTLGTAQELKKHAADMQKAPGMEHTDPNTVSLAPGKTGSIVWQFTRAGIVDFACLQPGHFESGMKGLVKVSR